MTTPGRTYMALTNTQLLAITDSIAKIITDFNAAFITNTGSNAPTATTITNGISGTGTTNTLGRVLNWLDAPSEENVLQKMQNASNSFVSYVGSIRSLAPVYQQFYAVMDALDNLLGGLNAYLTAQSIQVNAYFAAAFNAYVAASVAGAYRQVAPLQIAASNFFPYAAVDDIWDATASGATTFSTNTAGANAGGSSAAGGGVGQIVIYKVNAGNAAGGAALTVTYLDGSGVSHQATYNTTSGVPVGSGSLGAAYNVTGAIGASITGVTGTGMTSGEQYRFGIALTRAAAY